jgi:hypothetical protein
MSKELKTVKFAVLITKRMQKQMQRYLEVNWSRVARDAFQGRMDILNVSTTIKRK